jgi:hypothetical protein
LSLETVKIDGEAVHGSVAMPHAAVALVAVVVIVQGLLPVTAIVPVAVHPLVLVKVKVLSAPNVYVSIVVSAVWANFHVPTYVGVVVGVVAAGVVAAGVLEPPELPHAESEIKNRKLNR